MNTIMNTTFVNAQLVNLRLKRWTRNRCSLQTAVKVGGLIFLLVCFYHIFWHRPAGKEGHAEGYVSGRRKEINVKKFLEKELPDVDDVFGHVDFNDPVNSQGLVRPRSKEVQMEEPAHKQEKEDVYVGSKAVFQSGVLGNYEDESASVRREGPGEHGAAVHLTAEEKRKGDAHMREYGFNMAASDKVSLDRAIPDTRPDECKYWKYPSRLPKTSVVIVFHNEMWTTLLRTVHSIINRTPEELLEEILLLDDFRLAVESRKRWKC